MSPNYPNAEKALNGLGNIDSSVTGWAYNTVGNTVYKLVDANGRKVVFKGAEYQMSSGWASPTPAAGFLEVHLAGALSTSWYLMPLDSSGSACARIFDAVRSTGTTVAIANVVLFPE